MEQTGEIFNLDFAYYNGKYYSYYGIVPTILFYRAFIALVGIPPNNSFAIILFGTLLITACSRLVRCLCRRLDRI